MSDLPKYMDDGYRRERCHKCGHVIGYAHFWATRALGPDVVLVHGSMGTFSECPEANK